jgi:hypothetical protein
MKKVILAVLFFGVICEIALVPASADVLYTNGSGVYGQSAPSQLPTDSRPRIRSR